MDILETFYAKDRNEWRDWLIENHTTRKEIWLIYFKKHTNKPSVSYDEAVEEALCYGWIDSTVKKIDPERYRQKFTPRKDCNNWSELNKKRVRKLIAESRMTQAGLDRIAQTILSEIVSSIDQVPLEKAIEIPEYITQYFSNYTIAFSNFNALPPSHKREYVRWISSAKRDQTQQKRLKEALQLLLQNRKLGMK
ncbi:MAG: YdeI/OmpD-associated family protein [Blastocatellia bacterium]|nr:YdeI/OmpD-associated family protein [Blastocatellia bacterium]